MSRVYKPHNEETKRKISDSMKGKNNWMKGRKLSEETKKKMSESGSGRTLSPEWKKNIGKALKGKLTGRVRPIEERMKISESMKGEKNHFYGKKHSEESKKKMSESIKGMSAWNKGKKRTWESSGSFKKGQTPWNKGKEMSEEYCIKASLAQTGKSKFDGFYSSKNKRLRTNPKWKHWREQVFKRDNYTCRECNGKGVCLHPHHIIPVKEAIEQNIEELVYNVDNGVTLCKSCHYKKHKKNKIGD